MNLPITRHTSAVLASLPRVTVEPRRLNDALWPPCIRCQRTVNECRCEPTINHNCGEN